MGGTMRLGADPVKLHEDTRARAAYDEPVIYERHRHRYEVNNLLRRRLEDAGLVCSGTSPDDRLVEVIELPDHPFFMASQYHPEFKSRPNRPEPLFREFVGAALERARSAARPRPRRGGRRRAPAPGRAGRDGSAGRAPIPPSAETGDAQAGTGRARTGHGGRRHVRRCARSRARAATRRDGARPCAPSSSDRPRRDRGRHRGGDRARVRKPAGPPPGPPGTRTVMLLRPHRHGAADRPGRGGAASTASIATAAPRSSAPTTRPGSRCSSRRRGAGRPRARRAAASCSSRPARRTACAAPRRSTPPRSRPSSATCSTTPRRSARMVVAAPTYYAVHAEFLGTRRACRHPAGGRAQRDRRGGEGDRDDAARPARRGDDRERRRSSRAARRPTSCPSSCTIEAEVRSLDDGKASEAVRAMVDTITWAASATETDVDTTIEEHFRAYRIPESDPIVVDRLGGAARLRGRAGAVLDRRRQRRERVRGQGPALPEPRDRRRAQPHAARAGQRCGAREDARRHAAPRRARRREVLDVLKLRRRTVASVEAADGRIARLTVELEGGADHARPSPTRG